MKAVLFDAGNTLVFLDYPRMAAVVGAVVGLPLTGESLARVAPEAARAMEAIRATDRHRADAYLATMFRLAGVPPDRMDEVRAALEATHAEEHLWCRTAPGTAEALRALRDARLRLGVVSNSDGRVDAALEAAGIDGFFEVIVDSGRTGVEKPDPAIFHAALNALGIAPRDAVYVGDLYEVDVVGARSAGMSAVLYAPDDPRAPKDCPTVRSLAGLVDYLLPGERAAS